MSLGAYNALSKSPASPFESSSSFSFDGSDDVITTSADSTLASKTYSFWAKSTQTAEKNGIFDHGSAAVGAFRFNSSGTGPRLYLSSSSYRFWNDNSAQDDGNWHHHLLYVDPSNITNSKWIVDGVVQTPSTTSSGSADAYTSGIRIGTAGAEFFNGSLDEFAIFDGDQSALADAIYNNGQPTNLSSYSTLDHWFRMGEGKLGSKSDGENNLLFDQGPNGGLGSEKVTNGGFDSASHWTPSGGAVIENGVAKFTTEDSSFIIQTLVVPQEVRTYELAYEVLTTNGNDLRLSGGHSAFGNVDLPSATIGKKSVVMQSNGTVQSLQFNNSNPKFIGSIDNASLREVQGAGTISGAAIQADGGTELVTNGTFDTDVSGWSAAGNGALSYQNGVLRVTTSGGVGSANQVIALSSGATFTLTFDVVAETQSSGIPFFQVTSGLTNTGITSTGTHTIVATASSNNPTLTFSLGGAATNGEYIEIDNISVKEQTESVPKKVQNLRPIAPGERSLSFDGTDDLVDLGASSTFFSTNVNSISMWFKMPDTSGGAERIFVSNSDAGGSDLRVVVSTSGIISVDIWNGSSLVSTTGGSAIDDDIWHHLAYTTNASAQALYIDGVSVATTTHTRSSRAGSVSATIASHVTSGIYSDVDVDEVAIWDTVLDGDAVKAIYNAGQPTHLFVNTGAYDIYRDNLKAYYKMGDATNPAQDGTSNLLFDQTSPGLGSEAITNGDFSVDSDWNPVGDATLTIANGILSSSSSNSNRGPSQNVNTIPANTLLKIEITVLSVTGSGYVKFRGKSGNGGTGSTHLSKNLNSPAKTGTYTFFATLIGDVKSFTILLNQSGSFEIDNVSVREVNGNTGTISGATIQTESPKQIYALPPVANTKSIIFDGTNDHLVTQVDATAQPNNESRYYSFWCKASDTGVTARQAIFSHGGTTVGAFYLNFSSSRPLLYMASAVYQFWVDNPAQDSGEWAHWVVKIVTNDITACELWCDGVKQTKSDVLNSGSMNTYSSGITLGTSLGGHYLEGSIDEFSIHEELDEEAIRALFNRGRPIEISNANGAYDQGAKLLHWWRMGDATSPAADGTNDIIFQGLEAEGSELVPNGDLSTWTDTDTIATWTHKDSNNNGGGGVISQVGSGEGSGGTGLGSANFFTASPTNMSLTSGTIFQGGITYRLEIEVSRYVQGTIRVQGAVVQDFGSSDIVDGKIVKIATAPYNTFIRVQGSNACDFTIDNVSVKQLRGQYIGTELVKADADLYKDSTWFSYNANVETFPNGTAVRFFVPASGGSSVGGFTKLSAAPAYDALTANMETGCVYKLQFDFLTDDSDAYPRYYDGSSYTALSSGSGTKVFYFVYSGSTSTRIQAGGVSVEKFVQFSNLSLTKVGAAAVMTNMTTSDIQTDTPY